MQGINLLYTPAFCRLSRGRTQEVKISIHTILFFILWRNFSWGLSTPLRPASGASFGQWVHLTLNAVQEEVSAQGQMEESIQKYPSRVHEGHKPKHYLHASTCALRTKPRKPKLIWCIKIVWGIGNTSALNAFNVDRLNGISMLSLTGAFRRLSCSWHLGLVMEMRLTLTKHQSRKRKKNRRSWSRINQRLRGQNSHKIRSSIRIHKFPWS